MIRRLAERQVLLGVCGRGAFAAQQGRVMSSSSRFQVVHDRNKGQFQVSLTGGRMAVLEYEEEQPRDGAKEGSRVLDLYHTEVPPEFGGQGIAAALADAAFAHCSDNGYKMRLTCEYLHRYLQNNKGLPDSWRNLVVSEDP